MDPSVYVASFLPAVAVLFWWLFQDYLVIDRQRIRQVAYIGLLCAFVFIMIGLLYE